MKTLLKTSLPFIASIAMSLCTGNAAQAQAPVQPSMFPDNVLGTTSTVNTINCDMINTYGMETIVWDETVGTGSDVYFSILENSTVMVGPTLVAAGASSPDIAIAEQGSAVGPYNVLVVYQQGGNVYLQWYDYALGGSLNLISSKQLNSNRARSPHIDMIFSHGTSGSQLLDYVVTWQETNAGTNQVWFETGSVINIPTNTATFLANGNSPDVSGMTDIISGPPISKISFSYLVPNISGGSDLIANVYDLSTSTGSTCTLETAATIGAPRIESFGDRHPAVTNPYAVAASVLNTSSGQREIRMYDSTNVCVMAIGSNAVSNLLANTYDHIKPAIAAGVHGEMGIAFYPTYDTSLYFMHFGGPDANTFNMPGQFWELNNGTLSMSSLNEPAVALSGCSNCGGDPFFAAWWDGTQILYKERVAGQFKPTSVSNKATAGEIVIYPNPATDVLQVGNAAGAGYHISDIAGRILLQGKLQNDGINLQTLATGTYLIRLQTANGTSVKQFVKH